MPSGRKRSFDECTALNAAMNVFWQKGYVATSLSDLTRSMGINKPSMYSFFGNKEALFIKATQCYIDTKMQPHIEYLFEKDISFKQRFKKHMMSVVAMQCGSEQIKGCYLVVCQPDLVSGDIPKQATELLQKTDTMLGDIYTEIFTNDIESIALGLNVNAAANSLSVCTLLKGSAAMARSGVHQTELEYSVDTMLVGLGLH